MDEYSNDLKYYKLESCIGVGTFARTFAATHIITGLRVAIKVIDKMKFPPEKLQKEVHILKLCDHPCIASFYDFQESDKYSYIIQELSNCVTVKDYINKKGPIPEWLARHFFCQIVSALDYLHNRRHIVHRDIKLENIMVDRNGYVKLIDFGLSNTFEPESPFLLTFCGSPAYLAPEVLKNSPYTFESDVWSSGICLYAMLSGKLPFDSTNIPALVQSIVTSEPEYPPIISPSSRILIMNLLEKDPRQRYSTSEIFTHPWFCGYSLSSKMNGDFGVEENWRLDTLDEEVLNEINNKYKFKPEAVQYHVTNGILSPEYTIYRIIKKNKSNEEFAALTKREMVNKFSLQFGRASNQNLNIHVNKAMTTPTLVKTYSKKVDGQSPSKSSLIPVLQTIGRQSTVKMRFNTKTPSASKSTFYTGDLIG